MKPWDYFIRTRQSYPNLILVYAIRVLENIVIHARMTPNSINIVNRAVYLRTLHMGHRI